MTAKPPKMFTLARATAIRPSHFELALPAAAGSASSKWLGLIAVALASVNIFGGFAVTARMLAMYKKRERKDG